MQRDPLPNALAGACKRLALVPLHAEIASVTPDGEGRVTIDLPGGSFVLEQRHLPLLAAAIAGLQEAWPR